MCGGWEGRSGLELSPDHQTSLEAFAGGPQLSYGETLGLVYVSCRDPSISIQD